MKFFKLFGYVMTVVHIIQYGRAMESHTMDAASTLISDGDFIEILLQRLGNKTNAPLNIREIYSTLDYSQQRIEIITDLIVSQAQDPSASNDNLLSLQSTVYDVFDAMSQSTNVLEGSLNGVVGCVDLAVLDVQISLQVLIEAFVSNCDVLFGGEQHSAAIDSAVYRLSAAIKTLIMSMSDLADKIISSTEMFDGHTITGIQAIVQTVLSIVDRVVRTLKYINILDSDAVVEPNLDKFALLINRLANERFNLIPKMSTELVVPMSELMDSLRSTIEEVPKATENNMKRFVESLESIKDVVPEKQFIPTVISLLTDLRPNLSSLSNATHSMHRITDSVIYSTDVSLQNLMATTTCLSYYINLLTKISITDKITDLGSDLQSILCFIASNIRTLVEGITLTVERALVDLICASPTTDKMMLDKQLQELQALFEPILLTFEHIVRTSIQIVQHLMSISACTMGEIFDANLMEDMNRLIRNLVRIVNGMEVTVTSKQLLIETPSVDESETTKDDNIFSICIKSFNNVAHNCMNVRHYFIKSIEHIRKFLADVHE